MNWTMAPTASPENRKQSAIAKASAVVRLTTMKDLHRKRKPSAAAVEWCQR